ncbi:MAG: ATP-binding protein [Oscillospiraceae bacterium]
MMEQENSSPYGSASDFWREATAWGRLLLRACRRETGEEGTEDPRALRLAARRCWTRLAARSGASAEAGVFLPLPYLASVFGLDTFRYQCLTMTFLAETDWELETICGALEPRADGALTLRLLLRLLTGTDAPSPACQSAFTPEGVLLRCCLETDDCAGANQASQILRPARRLLDFVLSERREETGVPGLTLWQPRTGDCPPQRLGALAEQMDDFLTGEQGERVAFLLWGQPGAGRRTLARAFAARRGMPLLCAEGRFFDSTTGAAFRTAVLRESVLQQCPVCFTGLDGDLEAAATQPEAERWLTELLHQAAEVTGCALVICEADWSPREVPDGWRVISVPLPLPELAESRALWAALLEKYPLSESQDPDELAGKYRFTPGQMASALGEAAALARWRGQSGVDSACLAQGCRRQLHHALGDKARKVEAVFSWEDLILPDSSKNLLKSACDQMKYRRQVYGDWGFGKKLAYGAGLSLLFSGPPGTGKTMAAQIAAGELGLELYKVDLSAVVSKYIGETEKNLSEIFREAARSQAVLFFDEADVLFGKRTEVKDAHDKYNNMEAAYLLQKIEEYAGVSVLATNFAENFDEAFKRRLKFIIDFPFPDARYRLLLWHAIFPAQTPVEPDVDWEYLAGQFELTGSGIKNVAVNAAFLAAGEGGVVGMKQLLVALKRELFKSGKVLTREDFGEYYMLAE